MRIQGLIVPGAMCLLLLACSSQATPATVTVTATPSTTPAIGLSESGSPSPALSSTSPPPSLAATSTPTASSPSPTAVTITVGKTCAKAGRTATEGDREFACEKVGSAPVWVLSGTSDVPASEIDYLRVIAARVIEDAADADCRAKDGILVSSSIEFLAGDFDKLANDTAVPPGADPTKFQALAQTLSNFASQAAEEIDAGATTDGYARYEVVREEAKQLLAMINKSLGTKYRYTSTTC